MYLPKKNLSLLKIYLKILFIFLLISVSLLNFSNFKVNEVSAACGGSPPCRGKGPCKPWQCCKKTENGQSCKCQDCGGGGGGGGGSKPTPTPPPPPPTQPEPSGPFPDPYVPCDETRPEEFHSLRPYQASPCDQKVHDISLFCGNDLLVYDRLEIIAEHHFPGRIYITFTFEGQPIDGACLVNPNPGVDGLVRQTCWFTINRQKDIAIDLRKAYLPIMGFTEPSRGSQSMPYRVINSRYQSETLDDPAKVNEYVSWYLSSVVGRAEYDPPNMSTEVGNERVVDFSGPMKKLLSQESQHVIRGRNPNPPPPGEVTRAGVDRHNQIVACRNSSGQPVKCYPGGATKVRLNWWANQGNYPPLARNYSDFSGFWTAYSNWRSSSLGRIFEYIPFSSTEDRKGEVEAQTSPYQVISPSLYLTNVFLSNQEPAELFFAHMQESYELSDILQMLIVPQELPR